MAGVAPCRTTEAPHDGQSHRLYAVQASADLVRVRPRTYATNVWPPLLPFGTVALIWNVRLALLTF